MKLLGDKFGIALGIHDMKRSLAVAAVALLATPDAARAASLPPLDVSLVSLCDEQTGDDIRDLASDASASLVVEVTLFDGANRVIEQVPFITKANTVVSAHSVRKRTFTLAAKDGVFPGSVCTGHVTAVRVTPHDGEDALVELVVEASALRRADVMADQRKLTKAPEPDHVRIEEKLRMQNGKRLELKVGNGPVRRVAIVFGYTR